MPMCAVPNCNNTHRKGVLMKRVPNNPEREDIWLKNIGRDNWKPYSQPYICEIHFAEDAWEKVRVDGKKKLKFNAVPTIFPDDTNKNPKIVKPSSIILRSFSGKNISPQISLIGKQVIIGNSVENEDSKRITNFSNKEEVIISQDDDLDGLDELPLFDPHDYAMAPMKELEKNFESVSHSDEMKNHQVVEKLSKNYIEQERQKFLESDERLKRCEKILAKTEKSRINLKNNLRTLRVKLRQLEEVADESKILLGLKTVFNDDQMRALCRDGRSRVIWSDATMEKALKLRLTCGQIGYSELLRQNIPLPSSRSLRRALQISKFTKRFSNEVIEFLKTEFQNVKSGESEDTDETKDEIENEECNEIIES